jgi:hypothetical protein
MTQMENLLRAATKQTADEVAPDNIPALDLAMLPVPRRSRVRVPAVGPLLAAAAVALVVVLTVTLSTVLPSHQPSSADAIPPYYVALTATGTPADSHPVTLTVRSTSTGRVLATVAAPRPYGTFNLVEGTADDQTFLVGAQVWHPTGSGPGNEDNIPETVRLYLLRFAPATGGTSLTALPIPAFNGEYLQEASISPDGTRIAVGYQSTQESWIRVYTLPGGASRTLSLTNAAGDLAFDRDNPATIAWAADDRTISFVWSGMTGSGVYLANTDRAGDLLPRSRLVLPLSGKGSGSNDFVCSSDPFLSANGEYILCGGYTNPKGTTTSLPTGPVTQGFAEFSATTGKLVTILAARRGPLPTIKVKPGSLFLSSGQKTTLNQSALPYLLWSSPDGKVLIGTVNGKGVVIRDGREEPIPWSAAITGTGGSLIPAIASW